MKKAVSKTSTPQQKSGLKPSKPRVRVNLFSNNKGGVFSFTSTLVSGLINRGYSIKVTFLNQASDNRLTNSPNLQTSYLSLKSTTHAKALSRLLHRDSDVVHINFASFFPIAFLNKLMFKTPYVLTLHGLPQPALEYGMKSKVLYSVESMMVPFAVRHATATVCVSEYTRLSLKERYHAESKVIYHGIDTKNVELTDKQLAKKQLGFSENDPLILFVGALSLYKDPLTLLKGFNYILQKQAAHLVLVGKGELSEKVKATVETLGIQNSVHQFESIDEAKLIQLYNAADVFVLPTVNEAFGIVLLEAMAFGVPIVASDTGACMEVAGEAALYFRQGDPADLAKKMVQLLGDKQLREHLSVIGLKRVRENFTVDSVTLQYSRLFEKVSSGRR